MSSAPQRNEFELSDHPGLSVLGIALCLLFLAAAVSTGAAQEPPPPLEHLEVALWPEFDRPAMLVIYRFELTSAASLPTTVELPIPAGVGQPFAVAWQDAEGGLFDTQFEVGSNGIVSILIPQGVGGQLEYYADLNTQGSQRSFQFEWPGTVELAGFSYEVQQPLGADELSVSPAPDQQASGPFGLDYARADLGPQSIGSELAIAVSYRKATAGLSQPPAAGPLAPSQAETPGSADLLPYLLSGGGLLLVVAGVVYYLRGRPRSVPRRRVRPSTQAQPELEVSSVYCHQCGTKSKVNDSFCRNCGARLRQG